VSRQDRREAEAQHAVDPQQPVEEPEQIAFVAAPVEPVLPEMYSGEH
jgi:hypothetical protein